MLLKIEADEIRRSQRFRTGRRQQLKGVQLISDPDPNQNNADCARCKRRMRDNSECAYQYDSNNYNDASDWQPCQPHAAESRERAMSDRQSAFGFRMRRRRRRRCCTAVEW